MGFSWLRFYHFRNLEDKTVSTDAKQIFLVGKNGQGKTNFLEAVYFLCYGSSFRTRQDPNLIREKEKEMGVEGKYSTEDDILPHDLSIQYRSGKKSINLDEKEVRDRKELVKTVPCIVFSHEDIEFVNGAPERKRWFFNQTLSLYDEYTIDMLRNYRKILKMRNTAIKDERFDLLDAYDNQLARAGFYIQERRKMVTDWFSHDFNEMFTSISGIQKPVELCYYPSWRNLNSEADVVTYLDDRREKDIALGTTTSGPHRDRFEFMTENRNFTEFASTGQLRLMSLILRVLQARFFAGRTGRKPVFLIDDVLLEMDRGRRDYFLSRLPEYEQAFFTFLPDEDFSSYKKSGALEYRVENGRFENG